MDTFHHSLVTGANRGLGLEFTRALLEAGGSVVATCRQPGRAGELNALAGEHPGRLHVLPLELTDARARASLVADLALALPPGKRLDLLVNNAGVLHPGERFGHLSAETLEHSFRVNAAAPLLLTQTLAPQLDDGARILMLSSRLGSMACTQRFGTPSYAISKAALNMATAQLAHALSNRGMVVMAGSPGWARTDMGGKEAEVNPADAAAGLLQTLAGLAPEDSGGFFDWKGTPLEW